MSLFNRTKPEEKPKAPSLGLLDIQERMERLERKIRDLETDWAGQYDKFHRLNMRLAKRAKALEEAEELPEPAREDRAGATNGGRGDISPLAKQLLSRGRLG